MSLLSFVFSQVSVSPTKSNLLSRDLRPHSIFSIFLEILLQFIYKVDIQVNNIVTFCDTAFKIVHSFPPSILLKWIGLSVHQISPKPLQVDS